MLKRVVVVLAAAATVSAAFASAAAPSAKPRAYEGTVYGQIPGSTLGDVQQNYNGIALLVGKTSVDILIAVKYTCYFPSPPQGALGTGTEVKLLNLPMAPNGSFHTSGAFNQKNIDTAGKPGGTATVSGQISGAHASGTFSRSAHREGKDSCLAVSVTWKATYSPTAQPDLP